MFTSKRSDTLVSTVEQNYGINLNARSDMLLGNLLEERGFDSLTQLLAAYHRRLTNHARRRRTFLSFHAEDRAQVQGFRLMSMNPKLAVEVYDLGLQVPVDSNDSGYIKQVIREQIKRSSVLICLIGNGTAWRDWVDWEIKTAIDLRKGLCGVRLKDSRGRTPPMLNSVSAPIARWNVQEIISAIECAAARRS